MSEKVTPYGTENSKKEQVAEMFDNIASNYDFLNHFLSLGIDMLWRKRAIKLLKKENPREILDVATGTADFALQTMSIEPDHITGVDISNKMLDVGRVKIVKKSLSQKIKLEYGDSENLPFNDDRFDALTVAFGVRNFENLSKGLTDMLRVLKPNGRAVILEFSKPKKFPIKQVYNFYFKFILPFIGKYFSTDHRAYSYLPESVASFPEDQDFLKILEACGYKNCEQIRLSFGIASIYTGRK
jgi:demethylmenaquinone methyltransferase/2-methoxy-6-polyprenyl-1,4-benzoquinol methylase